MGGNLASVHDSQEYSAVQAVLRKATGGNNNAWIGGHDAVQVTDFIVSVTSHVSLTIHLGRLIWKAGVRL